MKIVQKHWKILLIVCLFLLAITGICMKISMNRSAAREKTIQTSLKKLESLAANKENISDIEKEIQEKDLATRTTRSVDEVTSQDNINTLNIRYVGSVVVGDSITEGLSTYEILDSDKVVYKRGISIKNTQTLLDTAAGLNPTNIFLAFGMNDVESYKSDIDSFIAAYQEKIDYVRKILPNTKIFINNIQPATDAVVAKETDFSRVPQYNEAISKMCEELSITYIDNQYILEEHPEFYEKDGIHFQISYYPLWLENMAEKAGI